MSTAVAAAPAALPQTSVVDLPSVRSYPPIAAASNSATPVNTAAARPSKARNSKSPPSMAEPQTRRTSSDAKSPVATRTPQVPKVVVKTEPASPDMRSARHRPTRLNLTTANLAANGQLSARPSAPLTAKETGGLAALQDVGIACLSPGFNTQDPTMREQLQRSLNVREQQRLIIEARQKGIKPPTDADHVRIQDGGPVRTAAKTPGTTKRKGPPPGLSINAPGHEQFANERVIQSAPLGQTFTGLRQNMQPLSRHVVNQPSSLSNTSHIHHVPATQTNNRLPPIADVFAGELQAGAQSSRNSLFPHSPGHSSHSNNQPPMPSPSYPPHTAHPYHLGGRPREYKSAEEAMQSMTGGREDLLPRVVHYGGHQPPTPPSPLQKSIGLGVTAQPMDIHRSGGTRRRDREEYEKDVDSPPLGRGPAMRRPPFGEGRDSPQTIRRKKERFIDLCAEAWDLFHS